MKLEAFATILLLVSASACATTSHETPSAHADAHADAQADAHPEPSPATEQHAWLKKFLGEWRSEAEMTGMPGTPAEKMEGSASARAIGDLWIVADMRGESPAGDMEAVLTLGYDPEKKRFVGTWVDSMFNHMWLYDGSLDAAGKVLTLEAKGPSFAGDGSLANYKDVYEFPEPGRMTLTSSAEGPDGKWTQFMSATFRRTK